jgi:hypothetical protein
MGCRALHASQLQIELFKIFISKLPKVQQPNNNNNQEKQKRRNGCDNMVHKTQSQQALPLHVTILPQRPSEPGTKRTMCYTGR